MRKMMMCGIAFLLGASMAFADVFSPTVMSLSAPSPLYTNGNPSGTTPLNFSVSSTVQGVYYFLVFTKGKPAENAINTWHQVNGIDTCLYVSAKTDMNASSSNGFSWTVRDEEGSVVPDGEYTFYLWGIDTKSSRVRATAGTTTEGGGTALKTFLMAQWNYRTIITHDSSGVPLANPILYMGDGSRSGTANQANKDTTWHTCKKWVLGNNYSDGTLYESCITKSRCCTGGLYFDLKSPDTFFKLAFAGDGPNASGYEIKKYSWRPNTLAEQDQTWGNAVEGHTGTFYVEAQNKFSHCRWYMGDLASDGTTLWFVDADAVDSGVKDFAFGPKMHAVDMASGAEIGTTDCDRYWLNIDSYSKGGKNVGGPLSMDYRNGYIALNSHMSCVLQMVNPNLGVDDGFYAWSNVNGDGVGDKNMSTIGDKQGLCNDDSADPYKYNLAFDDNLFSVFPCFQYTQSFGLVAPDGTGIEYVTLAQETNALKFAVEIIDYGPEDSAFDGLYTTYPTGGTLSTDLNSAWHYVGQDSFKGTLVVTPDGVAVQNPVAFSVKQNSPNPFNPTTTITFTLVKDGKTTVDVFNAAGQKVDTIINGAMKAGTHKVTWNAAKFSAGVYFYTVKSGSFSKTMKMTLLK